MPRSTHSSIIGTCEHCGQHILEDYDSVYLHGVGSMHFECAESRMLSCESCGRGRQPEDLDEAGICGSCLVMARDDAEVRTCIGDIRRRRHLE